MRSTIEFGSEPPAGTVVMVDEQQFAFTGSRPHQCRDGTVVQLLAWRAACAECGAEFEALSGLVLKGFSRRCATHRRPLKPVADRKKTTRIHVMIGSGETPARPP